jgi:hypothetical protein
VFTVRVPCRRFITDMETRFLQLNWSVWFSGTVIVVCGGDP